MLSEKERTATITGICITGEKLVIPSHINGYRIECIGKDDGEGINTEGRKFEVKEIVLPVTLKRIGKSAFTCFENLEKINIPSSVQKIGEYAFEDTSLKKIELKNRDIVLERGAFAGCRALEEIVWPNNQMTGTIGEGCFQACNLKELNYPNMKYQTCVGAYAFAANSRLKVIRFSQFHKKLYIPNSVFTNCERAVLIIPAKVRFIDYQVNPKLNTIIFLGKRTKFINLAPLVEKQKRVQGKTYLQIRNVVAIQGANVLKQVKNSYYGIENDVGEDVYCGGDNNYNFNHEMKPVNMVAIDISAPCVEVNNNNLFWKYCRGVEYYEIYYSPTELGGYKRIAVTKMLRFKMRQEGYYRVRIVRKAYKEEWKGKFSTPFIGRVV